MANIFLTSNTSYKPTSFDEYIKPVQLYQQMYEQKAAERRAMADAALTLESKIREANDPEFNRLYNAYKTDLDKARDQMIAVGYNSNIGNSLLRLRERLNTDIKPIGEAWEAWQKNLKEYDDLINKDETVIAQNPYLRKPGSYLYNTNQRVRHLSGAVGRQEVAALATTLKNDINAGNWNRILGGQYFERWKQAGLTKEQVLATLLNPNTEEGNLYLNTMLNQVLSTKDMSWMTEDQRRQYVNYLAQGLWASLDKKEDKQLENWMAKMAARRASSGGGGDTYEQEFRLDERNWYSQYLDGFRRNKIKEGNSVLGWIGKNILGVFGRLTDDDPILYNRFFTFGDDENGDRVVTGLSDKAKEAFEKGSKQLSDEQLKIIEKIRRDNPVLSSTTSEADMMSALAMVDVLDASSYNKNPTRSQIVYTVLKDLPESERKKYINAAKQYVNTNFYNMVMENSNSIEHFEKLVSGEEESGFDALRHTYYRIGVSPSEKNKVYAAIRSMAEGSKLKGAKYTAAGISADDKESLGMSEFSADDIVDVFVGPYGEDVVRIQDEDEVKDFVLPRHKESRKANAYFNAMREFYDGYKNGKLIITDPRTGKKVEKAWDPKYTTFVENWLHNMASAGVLTFCNNFQFGQFAGTKINDYSNYKLLEG